MRTSELLALVDNAPHERDERPGGAHPNGEVRPDRVADLPEGSCRCCSAVHYAEESEDGNKREDVKHSQQQPWRQVKTAESGKIKIKIKIKTSIFLFSWITKVDF
jgi:hypothetical protein